MANGESKAMYVVKLIGTILTALIFIVGATGAAYSQFATKAEVETVDTKYEVHCANIIKQQDKTDEKISSLEKKIDDLPEKIVKLLRQNK